MRVTVIYVRVFLGVSGFHRSGIRVVGLAGMLRGLRVAAALIVAMVISISCVVTMTFGGF